MANHCENELEISGKQVASYTPSSKETVME